MADDSTTRPSDGAPAAGPPTGDPLGLISGGEGIFTGTVVCAAVIAYGANHLETTGRLSIAILGTVLVYWLAHLHARSAPRSPMRTIRS